MKKTLIALAALAATGASFAQVTITGNLTAGYQQNTTNTYSGLQSQNIGARLPLALAGVVANSNGALNYTNATTLYNNGTPLPAAVVGAVTAGQSAAVVAGVNAALATNAALQPRTAAQNSASGFGVDTAEITFNAKEDLGGGQTIEAKLGLENISRGNTASAVTPISTGFGPSDVTLTYTNTSFGRIQLGATRGAPLMSGTPSAGAPVIHMDDKLFERRSNSEFVSFVTKAGSVVVGYMYGESTGGMGLGLGTSGAAGGGTFAAPQGTRQRNNSLFAAYEDSGLKLEGLYRAYDNIDSAGALAFYGGISRKDALVLNAGYDFGTAKVGFGYNMVNAAVGSKIEYMMAGASMPLGALTLGATYGTSKLSGVSDLPASAFNVSTAIPNAAQKLIFSEAEGTATGWSIGASYALSKRTAITANYAAWTRAGYEQIEQYFDTTGGGTSAIGYGPIETQANLFISHSF